MPMGGSAAAGSASAAVHPTDADGASHENGPLPAAPQPDVWTLHRSYSVASSECPVESCDSHGGAEQLDEELDQQRDSLHGALRQAEVFIEEEPSLVHTRHPHCSAAYSHDHAGAAYAWSPATPELAELIPIRASPSPRESLVGRGTEASPYSPFLSRNASPRMATLSSATRPSTSVGGSARITAAPRHPLSEQSSLCAHSPGTESVPDTLASSIVVQREVRDAEQSGTRARAEADDASHVDDASTAADARRFSPGPAEFRRCATAAPTSLTTPVMSIPQHSPSFTRATPPVAPTVSDSPMRAAAKATFMNLRVEVRDRDGQSPSPLSTPIALTSPHTAKTNASGGAIPAVPAIKLPITRVPSGIESDRGLHLMGYGPRSAPNACTLASARSGRSGRSSRSARYSQRCLGLSRTMLPSLRELFPTLPEDMYLARDRLCVSHDTAGRLGVGAYGTVQRAELFPPDVEVPRFFTPVTETGTNASIPSTPRYSPANGLLSSQNNFTSIAGAVSGGESGNGVTGTATAAAGAPLGLAERTGGFMHSRLASMWSTDSVSTLPLHQQPYNDHTASFYNGLDDVPRLLRAESLSDPHISVRGQTPEAEAVVLCGPLTVTMESEGTSAPVTVSPKRQDGVGALLASSLPADRIYEAQQQQHEERSRSQQGKTPLCFSVTSCTASQLFPDLPAVLTMKMMRGNDVGGFSLTSPQISVARLGGEDGTANDGDDNCVRRSGSVELGRHAFASPLQNSVGSQEAELSQTSTTGTRQFTSPNSPRCDTRRHLQSRGETVGGSSSAGQREQALAERGAGDESDGRASNSTTLPTQLLFEGDESAVAVTVGDEGGSPFQRLAARRTTKAHPTEMPLPPVVFPPQSTTQPHTHVDVGAVALREAAQHTAALRLPLVLSRTACTATTSSSSVSGQVTGSSGDDCDGRPFAVTPAAEEQPEKGDEDGDGSIEQAGSEGQSADAVPGQGEAGGRTGRLGSIGLVDGHEISFLASVNFPELYQSVAHVGDDTLNATARLAVARAVREAQEEMNDALALLDTARQSTQSVAAESGRGDGEGVAQAAVATAATVVTEAVQPPLSSAGAAAPHQRGGSSVEAKRADLISPTSTVSSLFSGGVTGVPTQPNSKRGSVGIALHATANPLQSPDTAASATPLLRFGVNSMMVSEAFSNGCAPFRPVATKVVEKSDLADSAMKLNAFHNELRMASRLNHPCLVNVFGVAEDAENFYLVMDLAEKDTLAQYLKKYGVRDTRLMAPRFLADVVLALEYLRDGSQHTYWMTAAAAADAAKNGHGAASVGGAASTGIHRTDAERPPDAGRCDAGSFLDSTSTLSVRVATADVSTTTTPSYPTLQSVPSTLLQRHIDEGERHQHPHNTPSVVAVELAAATAATAEEEDAKADQRSEQEVQLLNADCAAEPVRQLLTESIVLHRDVKPDNLLLTWDYHVKLADFGDACFLGDEEANTFGGTPSYISPEVIQRSKAGPYSDLWAVGCILYELLVGEKLFSGSLREVASSIQAFDPDQLVFPDAAATPAASPTSTNATAAADAAQVQEEKDGDSAASASLHSSTGITDAAKDLVRQLLRPVPTERLGAEERGGFAALKRHPFFAEIDWATVLQTTNVTTTNTDYTAELADYLDAGEHVVYCSPVKVLPTSEALHTRSRSVPWCGRGALVMVLTDAPRLFLVDPDTDTVPFAIPWSSELRVAVLRADRFTISVPIHDVVVSPATPGVAFSGAASTSTTSKASASATATTLTYTFYDTTRRADLWGVKIHHTQTTCRTKQDSHSHSGGAGGTPTLASRQSSTQLGCGSNTSGVPPLHWPSHPSAQQQQQQTAGQRRGTPTLSPRVGGSCLLHCLRTTPRSARAGSLSTPAVSFTESAVATPREGRSAGVSFCAGDGSGAVAGGGVLGGNHSSSSGGGAATHVVAVSPATTPTYATVAAAAAAGVAGTGGLSLRPRPITCHTPAARPPATSLVARSAPQVAPPSVLPGKSTPWLISPVGNASISSSADLQSPELMQTVAATTDTTAVATPVFPPAHRRTSAMTVTIASSTNPRSSLRIRPPSMGGTESDASAGVSPVDVGAAVASGGWGVRAAAAAAVATEAASTGGSAGGSLCDDLLGLSGSAGENTPHQTRLSDSEERTGGCGGGGGGGGGREGQSEAEATPGPPSAQRHVDAEAGVERGCSTPSSCRSDGDACRGGCEAGARARSGVAAAPATAQALPKEKISEARQQYKKTQRMRTGV